MTRRRHVAAAAARAEAGIEFVPGIEITAVVDGGDVHVLGYFVDPDVGRAPNVSRGAAAPSYRSRPADHRSPDDARHRAGRRAMLQPGLEDTAGPRAGRGSRTPSCGGHVADTREAFDRGSRAGKPAFVPRAARRPLTSLRGYTRRAALRRSRIPGCSAATIWIRGFARAGLDALEAHHSEHDARRPPRYLAMADRYGLAVSGGSDYHGDASHGAGRPGSVSLPRAAFQRAERRSRGEPRDSLGRRDFLVEQHVEAVEFRAAARPARADDPATSVLRRAPAALR